MVAPAGVVRRGRAAIPSRRGCTKTIPSSTATFSRERRPSNGTRSRETCATQPSDASEGVNAVAISAERRVVLSMGGRGAWAKKIAARAGGDVIDNHRLVCNFRGSANRIKRLGQRFSFVVDWKDHGCLRCVVMVSSHSLKSPISSDHPSRRCRGISTAMGIVTAERQPCTVVKPVAARARDLPEVDSSCL